METKCFLKLVLHGRFLQAQEGRCLASWMLNRKLAFQLVSRVHSRRPAWLTRGPASGLPNFLKSRRSSGSTLVPIQIAS